MPQDHPIYCPKCGAICESPPARSPATPLDIVLGAAIIVALVALWAWLGGGYPGRFGSGSRTECNTCKFEFVPDDTNGKPIVSARAISMDSGSKGKAGADSNDGMPLWAWVWIAGLALFAYVLIFRPFR